MNNHTNLIDLFKKNDERIIRKFYNEHKNGFILFAKRYKITNDDIVDIYQEAIIALIENAKKGKIDSLQSSVSTYFFSIGKFMIFQKLKKENSKFSLQDFSSLEYIDENYTEENFNTQVALLQLGLQKMGEKCKRILELFYYEEKKMDEIKELLGYDSKDVLKSQKSRCLKQLKDSIKEN